jgi:hypothetical protein
VTVVPRGGRERGEVVMEAGEFAVVEARQRGEDAPAARRELNVDHPVVVEIAVFGHESGLLGALHQGDHGVVAMLEVFREIGDGGPPLAGEAGDTEHELMLQGRDAAAEGGAFAEPEKNAESIPEAGEVAVEGRGGRGAWHAAIYVTS